MSGSDGEINVNGFLAAFFWGFALGVAVGGMIGAGRAQADETPHRCRPATEWRAEVEARGGKIEALKGDQWQFLRGISVMDPRTPPGLPYGEGATLVAGSEGGIVVFVDGLVVCDPMLLPAPVVEMLKDVGEGKVLHPGDGA